MNIIFSQTSWKQYTDFQNEDKKTLKKINALIRDIERNGVLKGIGKPEALKYRKAYSRRIDEFNRLIYLIENDNLIIIACKGHYED